ncbi:hypothetical protein XU18_1101 [Perkinsela sp. CCAP 1560/4]|nr:hypothetical protein XU18_1101 [Perkinsela sp. CCAP 1560/4]|eukprot:KNH08388.1 hypothetical protein XU18_1101 [Perkinsela sp. CCAP 1560/4]
MERFAKTCVYGTIPTLIEPYSLATSNKKVAAATLSASYVGGSVLKEGGIWNYPEILRRYVLAPHITIACKNTTRLYGKPIAKHGFYQRNVADIAANVYALDSILPLIETTAEGNPLKLVVASTGKRLMDRVFRKLYGMSEYQEAYQNIRAIHNDAVELHSSIQASVVPPSALPSVEDLIPIDVIPNVHDLFQTESKLLLDALKDLFKDTKSLTDVQRTICIQKLWSCCVVLWRASEALSTKKANAYHESLLAVKYCNQVRSEIRADKLQADQLRNYENLVRKYDVQDIPSLDMICFQATSEQKTQQ